MSEWSGKRELESALKQLRTTNGTSSSQIKSTSKVVLANIKEYKKAVYLVEQYIWKSKPEHRLAGFYVMDAVMKQAKAKWKDKDPFGKRFLMHLTQTLAAIDKMVEKDQKQAKRVVMDWQQRGLYSSRDILKAGGEKYMVENQKKEGDKFSALLSMLKQQREISEPEKPVEEDRNSRRVDKRKESRWSRMDREDTWKNSNDNNGGQYSQYAAEYASGYDARQEAMPRQEEYGRNEYKEVNREVCINFTLGKCSRGDTCRRSHDAAGDGSVPLEVRLKKTKMCSNISQPSGCRFGDRCNFAHDPSELVPFSQVSKVSDNGQSRNTPYKNPPQSKDSIYGPPPTRDSHYGGPPPPTRDSHYGGPPPPQRDSHYGGPPPPQRDSHYGGPPPPTRDSHYGGPPPPTRDSHYGGPPPPSVATGRDQYSYNQGATSSADTTSKYGPSDSAPSHYEQSSGSQSSAQGYQQSQGYQPGYSQNSTNDSVSTLPAPSVNAKQLVDDAMEEKDPMEGFSLQYDDEDEEEDDDEVGEFGQSNKKQKLNV